jgi:hypothetical protein
VLVSQLDAMRPRCGHGRGLPEHCSQCAAVPARHVEVRGGVVVVDEQPTRSNEPPALSARQARSARHGNTRSSNRSRKAA